MKKRLGQLKRAVVGFIENYLDKPSVIPVEIKSTPLTRSVAGRDVLFYTIGNGPKKILFVSAIHGNEVGTTKLTYELMNYLYHSQNQWSALTFIVIPCLNVDGYNQALARPDYLNGGRIGRLNANNVDLNRNFPTKDFQTTSDWTHGKKYQERTEVFCGKEGGSEPEIAALLNLIKKEQITTYFAFHSAGRDVTGNDNPIAQRLARLFSEKTGYRLCDLTEWKELKQTGTAKAWCDEQGMSYVEVEASSRRGSDWKNQRDGLIACIELLAKHEK